MKKKKIERWDEHLVIAVMVISAICILIMLTSFMSVTGKADSHTTSIMNSDGVLNTINTGTVVKIGDGPTKCDHQCGKDNMYAFVSHNGEIFVENNQIISRKYTCSCIKI